MTDKKIKDVQNKFKEHYTGIFDAIATVSVGAIFTPADAEMLDTLYTLERGDKWATMVSESFINGEIEPERLAEIVWMLYQNQWKRFKAYTNTEYNPIENYDKQSEIKTDRQNNMTNTGTTTDKVSAFNSPEMKESGSTNTNGSNTDIGKEVVVERTHGNIGVTTNAQMLEGDSKFWKDFNIYRQLFDDVDNVLALSVY